MIGGMNAAMVCPNMWLSGSRFRKRIGREWPHVFAVFLDALIDRLQVREDVAMRDGDAFGFAGGAGGEQDFGNVVGCGGRERPPLRRSPCKHIANWPDRACKFRRRFDALRRSATRARSRLPQCARPRWRTNENRSAPRSRLRAGIPRARLPIPADFRSRKVSVRRVRFPRRAALRKSSGDFRRLHMLDGCGQTAFISKELAAIPAPDVEKCRERGRIADHLIDSSIRIRIRRDRPGISCGLVRKNSTKEEMISIMSTAVDSANLILKLYELRREETMRKAREFVFGFDPKSAQEYMAGDDGPEQRLYRMVTSYWEMAASFVVNRSDRRDHVRPGERGTRFRICEVRTFLADLRAMMGPVCSKIWSTFASTRRLESKGFARCRSESGA